MRVRLNNRSQVQTCITCVSHFMIDTFNKIGIKSNTYRFFWTCVCVCVCVCVCTCDRWIYLCLPIQPGQQTLSSTDQLNHGGQELVGGLMGDFGVVSGVLPALRHGAAQVVVRRSHLPHQSLQVVRLHTVVLSKKQTHINYSSQTIHYQYTGIIKRLKVIWITQSTQMSFFVVLKLYFWPRMTERIPSFI